MLGDIKFKTQQKLLKSREALAASVGADHLSFPVGQRLSQAAVRGLLQKTRP